MLREVQANSGEGQVFEFVAPTLLRLLIEGFTHRVSPITLLFPSSIGDRSDLDQVWLRKRE